MRPPESAQALIEWETTLAALALRSVRGPRITIAPVRASSAASPKLWPSRGRSHSSLSENSSGFEGPVRPVIGTLRRKPGRKFCCLYTRLQKTRLSRRPIKRAIERNAVSSTRGSCHGAACVSVVAGRVGAVGSCDSLRLARSDRRVFRRRYHQQESRWTHPLVERGR